jgi:hypothetical protein
LIPSLKTTPPLLVCSLFSAFPCPIHCQFPSLAKRQRPDPLSRVCNRIGSASLRPERSRTTLLPLQKLLRSACRPPLPSKQTWQIHNTYPRHPRGSIGRRESCALLSPLSSKRHPHLVSCRTCFCPSHHHSCHMLPAARAFRLVLPFNNPALWFCPHCYH